MLINIKTKKISTKNIFEKTLNISYSLINIVSKIKLNYINYLENPLFTLLCFEVLLDTVLVL